MKRANLQRKNQLREFLFNDDLKQCGKQTQKGLFRSVIEPVLSQNSIVLLRIFDSSGLVGLLQRLEFSNSKIYSFSDILKSNNIENLQKEDIWNNTEFVIILANRYSVMMVWDYDLGEKEDFCTLKIVMNSKNIADMAKNIAKNSLIDFSSQIDEFQPDRRNNDLMNEALNKIINFTNEINEEAVLKQVENEALEDNFALFQRYEGVAKKISLVSHEIKNHLSVIDLYSKVIEKRMQNFNEQSEKSILNAIDCINRSKGFIGVFLSEIKELKSTKIEQINIRELIKNTIELATPKAKNKDIEIKLEKSEDFLVMADKTKLTNVLINLIYNAIEAIDEMKNDGTVLIKINLKDDFVSVKVKDNGSGIPLEEQGKVFNLEFTTKPDGNGYGLYISKEAMKEQNGDLNLVNSTPEGSEFELLIPKLNTEKEQEE